MKPPVPPPLHPSTFPSQVKLVTLNYRIQGQNFGLDGQQTGLMETAEGTEDRSASTKLHRETDEPS